MSISDLADFSPIITTGLLIWAVVAGLQKAKKHHEQNPQDKPFRWGFVCAHSNIFVGGFLALMLAKADVNVGMTGGARFLLWATSAIKFCCGFAMLRRERWACVIGLFSFNPILLVINAVYLWKRWGELAPKRKQKGRQSIPESTPVNPVQEAISNTVPSSVLEKEIVKLWLLEDAGEITPAERADLMAELTMRSIRGENVAGVVPPPRSRVMPSGLQDFVSQPLPKPEDFTEENDDDRNRQR